MCNTCHEFYITACTISDLWDRFVAMKRTEAGTPAAAETADIGGWLKAETCHGGTLTTTSQCSPVYIHWQGIFFFFFTAMWGCSLQLRKQKSFQRPVSCISWQWLNGKVEDGSVWQTERTKGDMWNDGTDSEYRKSWMQLNMLNSTKVFWVIMSQCTTAKDQRRKICINKVRFKAIKNAM